MSMDLVSLELSPELFLRISQQLYRLCGIHLPPGKEALVKTRLAKRLRALGLGSFKDYLRYVEHDRSGHERDLMMDALTTNKTSFFREPKHFDYLRQRILSELAAGERGLHIWSAGCSSGEEPFSIAILLREEMPEVDRRDVRILATDISTGMLAKARQGIYEQEALSGLLPQHLLNYFTWVQDRPPRAYRINDAVRAMVRFARLNLMEAWPMKGPFQVIFCRNVMIYFDRPTQQELVQRFWRLLEPGGHLLVGHSESLSALAHEFRYVQPAIYRRF